MKSERSNNSDYLSILRKTLSVTGNNNFIESLINNCVPMVLEKNETLIRYQEDNKKMFFIVSGSFVRNIISSKGEAKTIMFHTENFHEFMKAYDTIYFHEKTNYEIKANEKSVVLSFDYNYMHQLVRGNLDTMLYFTQKTEELLKTLDVFRNFQLALTSEEYLIWLYDHYTFLFQRFPAQNIASFMGITPVWLSKLKAKFIS